MTVVLIDLALAELRRLADDIAAQLYADLWAGKLAVIGIDQIEQACDAAISGPRDALKRERLIDQTVRRVVERASRPAPQGIVESER